MAPARTFRRAKVSFFLRTSSLSALVFTDLKSSNTSYTFTVTATNSYGTSAASSASNSVTATTVPNTPTMNATSSVSNQATDVVSWNAPADGGSAITNYHWTSDDGKSGDTASTSVNVAQEAGTSQSYNVYATNANGNSNTSSYSSAFTSFSFAPFGFAPFGAFGFTPFGFTPFGFTPFGAFGFTPWGKCIHEDTLIETVNGPVQAKNIKVGDTLSTINIAEIASGESYTDWKSITTESLTNLGNVETTVTSIIPKDVYEVIWFNNDESRKYSLTQPLFIKGDPYYTVIDSGRIIPGNVLIEIAADGSIVEIPVTSVHSDEALYTVYDITCEPYNWFIAGGYLMHNH